MNTNEFVQKFQMAILAVFSVLVMSSAGWAATYYVDTTKGNDSNSGTSQLPVKTISKGVELAQAGDTIWIHSGTYREMITLFRSGTDAAHTISIRPVSGANVIIKGSDIVNGWEQHSGSIWKRTDWPINSQQVFIDGIPLQQIGKNCKLNTTYWGPFPVLPPVGTGLSDMTPGSFFYDQEKKILYVKIRDASQPNDHLIEASVRDFIISSYDINFIELHNLHFSHSNVTSIPSLMGMVNIQGKSWLVESCTFTYGDWAGLNVLGEGHRIINNVCNYNGSVGISPNGSDLAHNWKPYEGRPPQDIVLEGNETSFNNYRGVLISFGAGGIKACNSCNGVKVIRHTAKSNNGPGVWFDLYCQNITIDRCLLKNNTRGIEYEMCGKAVISNNLIIGNTDHGIYVSASDSVNVLNNTVNNNKYGIVLHGMPRTEHPSLKNNVVRNNIIGESSLAHLVVYSNSVTATGNTSDNNLFLSYGEEVKISWTSIGGFPYEVNYTNLKSFFTATQQGKNSFAAIPLWSNSLADDYSLSSKSPGIDVGTNEIDVGENDYLGHDRKLDGNRSGESIIDIGAYEFVPLASPLAPPTGFHMESVQ